MTKEAFSKVLLAVSDWKVIVDDVNGLSCEEFAKLLSKASGEKVSLRWLESCFQFTQNGRIHKPSNSFLWIHGMSSVES